MSARKLWFATDDVSNVRDAFTAFEFNSHQNELSGIIKMANELADQETGVPMMLQKPRWSYSTNSWRYANDDEQHKHCVERLVKQFDDMALSHISEDTMTTIHLRITNRLKAISMSWLGDRVLYY